MEDEDARCRICYLTVKPLITICECSGSIEYVHEDCVIDWITHKMEISEVLEIPKCEICRTEYSAQLKVGRKRLSFELFLSHIN